MTSRAKTTPASTGGSYAPATGAKSRVTIDESTTFSDAELGRLEKAGMSAETIKSYHRYGFRNVAAMIAWDAAGYDGGQAASLLEQGWPGPVSCGEDNPPHRRNVSNLAGLRDPDSPAPGWPGPYQTVHGVTGRRWDGAPVNVTCHVQPGIPSFSVVGMADEQQRALRDRLRAAMIVAGYQWPGSRITLSGVPAADSRTDAAFAVAILQATGQINPPTADSGEIWGELGLDGTIHDSEG